jgi:hypothetical protein
VRDAQKERARLAKGIKQTLPNRSPAQRQVPRSVIAGLDPAIHSTGFNALRRNGMDARIKSGQKDASGPGFEGNRRKLKR